MKNNRFYRFNTSVFILVLCICALPFLSYGQQWIKNMPGNDQYRKMSAEIRNSFKSGRLSVTWIDGGKAFEYGKDGKKFRYEIKSGKTTEVGTAGREESPFMRFRRMGGGPARGRQFESALSPDSTMKAVYRNRNLYLTDKEGKNEIAITTEGSEAKRLKFGTASWVFGEELDQITAMWWSPDSKKIAFYRFDETNVKDYYLQYKQTIIQDSVEIEPYTKVGAVNPVVDILIYDIASKRTITVDVRDGKPFGDFVTGHYVYGVNWAKDGSELYFHRTNRQQNVLEWTAADPQTGKCRAIVHEEWLPSYVENSPEMKFLDDNKRFIWTSERTGFKNYYLYDISGKLIATLTNHPFEVAGIMKLDEKAGMVYYMARSGDNHQKLQLHRVKLDGSGDIRLTDPVYNHTVDLSPDGKYFIDVAQTHDIPPFTNLVDSKGKIVAELSKSDLSKFDQLGLKKVEVFTYLAADGKTLLHGMLHFPSNFDPSKKYPLLVSNYGGPATNEFRETFATPSSLSEYGFLIASVDGRNAAGKGKAVMDALYGKLGYSEMEDFAAGVKSLYNRPYLDKTRVGIFGTSFGGTTSAMCLLRFPDVFSAACANSGVMDWRNYDNIYTERYMNLLDKNREGYEITRVAKYAENLNGKLMIYYGTSDNNVHPSNSLQLIQALQRAGKSFEVQVGPDMGHTAVNTDRMMEFFIQNLVLGK
jgi:dipeptidyl-peptidase 4